MTDEEQEAERLRLALAEPKPERMPGESLIAWARRMATEGRP